MKIAFLFPGQGSQYVGMGSALYQTFETAKRTYEEASDRLGWDMAKLCFHGPEETLNQTEYTQPAILTTSIAAWRALDVKPQAGLCVAGHSLGEYTALVAAEAISFGDAVSLVRKRGRFMQWAVGLDDQTDTGKVAGKAEGLRLKGESDLLDQTDTGGATASSGSSKATGGVMAAIIGLDKTTVQGICEKVSTPSQPVTPANFNAPDQIVIAGQKDALEKAIARAEEAHAKRVIRLAVSVPSHSPLMRPACIKLKEALELIPGKDLAIPLINNLEAKAVTRWSDAKAALVDQLAHPLLWEQSIQTMRNQGADFFIEIGPGRVLSGLLKRIDRTLQGTHLENPETIEKARGMMRGGAA